MINILASVRRPFSGQILSGEKNVGTAEIFSV